MHSKIQISSVSIILTHLDSTFFFYHRDSVFGWTQCSNYTVFICFTSSNSLNNIAIIVLQLHQLLGALMSPITPSSVVYCAAYYIVTMICTCIYEHLVLLTVRLGCLRSVFVYFFLFQLKWFCCCIVRFIALVLEITSEERLNVA